MNHPICVGTYERGHSQCDGVAASPSPIEQAACAWRDRCVGLQAFCQERHHNPQKVISALGSGLVDLCTAQIAKLRIVQGVITLGQPKQEQPITKAAAQPTTPPKPDPNAAILAAIEQAKATAQAISAKARATVTARQRIKQRAVAPIVEPPAPTTETNPTPQRKPHQHPPRKRTDKTDLAVVTLANCFADDLREVFKERTFARPKRVVAHPGTFYKVERGRSRYVRWYCTAWAGRNKALACLRYKPRSATLDVALPVTPEQIKAALGADVYDRLLPTSIADGQFKCVCKNLDRNGVAQIVAALGQLVQTNTIELPPPHGR